MSPVPYLEMRMKITCVGSAWPACGSYANAIAGRLHPKVSNVIDGERYVVEVSQMSVINQDHATIWSGTGKLALIACGDEYICVSGPREIP